MSKGETPPVKERLEFQLGQPLEKPLTQGLLAVLHKQVSYTICIKLDVIDSFCQTWFLDDNEVTLIKDIWNHFW